MEPNVYMAILSLAIIGVASICGQLVFQFGRGYPVYGYAKYSARSRKRNALLTACLAWTSGFV